MTITMGLITSSKLNGMPSINKNGNIPSWMANGRKRALTVTATAALPNNGRLSQAKLQRVFITMLGVVFLLWSTLTIIMVHQGQNSVFEEETQQEILSPTFVNQINSQKILQHIARLNEERDNKANEAHVADTPQHNKPSGLFQKGKSTKPVDRTKLSSAKFDMEEVDIHEMKHPEELKKSMKKPSLSSSRILTAHLEPINMNDWETKPLPVRNTTQNKLTKIEYPRVNSCQRLPELWPIDDYPDADPFLPWIHDVFPTDDGKFIQIVAQNKRRCQTGTTPDQIDILEKMQPQLSLFQHVPIKRIRIGSSDDKEEIRYKLTSHEEADPDGVETRFICRFSDGQETLSQFNFDYEYVAKRKRMKQTFTQSGHKDTKSIHTSQLIFKCPVPENLVHTVREGISVVDDQATLYLSLIPVRTPPRYGAPDRFLPPRFQEGKPHNFTVSMEWGDSHILPRVVDSGRWENIPICLPTYKAYPTATMAPKEVETKVSIGTSIHNATRNTKKHRVVGCAWASLSYSTRGDRFNIDDGARRADEWIRFHLLTEFDHLFIYDNSHGENNLKEVTDQFPDRVTRVPWPATICNNNRSFHDSPGERSSQYAAESACRLRFGPHTDWMANIDIDEFITPVGEYSSIKPLLSKLDDEETKIISLGSWRACKFYFLLYFSSRLFLPRTHLPPC